VKKYGVLNDLIKREFKTLGVFSRESGIPKASLCLLINGKYGSNETKIIKRVNEQMRKLRPALDLKHLWDPTYAWYQSYVLEKSTVKNGFRILVDVKVEEEGQLTIAPSVEGY
jgi:hypothetical protein